MDVLFLSKLVKAINPNKLYEYEFNDIKETKTGKDWIGTFVSSRNRITNKDTNTLIEHFTKPLEESQIKKSNKNKIE